MTDIKLLITIGILIIIATTSCNNKSEISVPTSSLSEQSSQILTTQQWLDDFEELYTHLKSDHRSLFHTANPSDFLIDPTIVIDDFQLSKDDGALINLATLPVTTPPAPEPTIECAKVNCKASYP